MADYDLQRFVDAQDSGKTYERALAEVRRGRKESHWMWFVFPQIAGLGGSPMARRFAISGLDEAKAYLLHPVLGARLREVMTALAGAPAARAVEIFGEVDAMKLRSCLTLFMRTAPDEKLFADLLTRFYAGIADDATDARLASSSP